VSDNFYDKFYYKKSNFNGQADILAPSAIKQNKFYKRLICPEPGKKLLDVGCGTGTFLKALEESGVDLWGIDISKNASEFAKKRVRKPEQIICADANTLPFNDDEFDYLTAWGVIEHFPSIPQILKEVKRVVKKGGKIAIATPNIYYYKFIWQTLRKGSGPVKHQEIESLYSFKEWKDLIESAGLSILTITRHNKFNKSIVSWLRNFLIPFYLSNHFVFICTK